MSFSTNTKAQERLKQRERFQERQRADDLKAVMALLSGRRFLYALINGRCALQSTVLGAEASTLHEREGRRSIGAELTEELQAICPPEYTMMIAEAIEASQQDRAHLKDASDIANREDENE